MTRAYFDVARTNIVQNNPTPFWNRTAGFLNPRDGGTLTQTTMADFSGSQWLECADHADFAISNGKMSVTFTSNRRNANLSNATYQDRGYLGQYSYGAASGGGWQLTEGDGTNDNFNVFLWLATNSTGTAANIVGTRNGTTNGTGRNTPWTTCTVVIDLSGSDHTTKVKFYLDGVLQPTLYYSSSATLASTTAFQNPTSPFNIGRFQGLGRYYEGGMTRIGFWQDTALTAENASTLWNSGNPLDYAGVSAAGLTSGLKLFLNCTETSGTRSDSSGNAHHFTEGSGTQNSYIVNQSWRNKRRGTDLFSADIGKAPTWTATGFRSKPAIVGRGSYNALQGAMTNWLRNAAQPMDIGIAINFASGTVGLENGIIGLSDTGNNNAYSFLTTFANAGSTKNLATWRLRQDSNPNHMLQIDSPTLAEGANTIWWRWAPGGGTLADYKGWINGTQYDVIRREVSDGAIYDKNFADVPTAGNNVQGLGCFVTGTAIQGYAKDWSIGGIWILNGLNTTQSAAARTWFESWAA